jgi:hypothetical protein
MEKEILNVVYAQLAERFQESAGQAHAGGDRNLFQWMLSQLHGYYS